MKVRYKQPTSGERQMSDGTMRFTYKGKLLSFNLYEIFFAVLGILIIAPLIATVALLMYIEFGRSVTGSILALFVLAQISVGILLNLGEPKPTAKDVFWVGIFFSVGFLVASFVGWLEIEAIRYLF